MAVKGKKAAANTAKTKAIVKNQQCYKAAATTKSVAKNHQCYKAAAKTEATANNQKAFAKAKPAVGALELSDQRGAASSQGQYFPYLRGTADREPAFRQ